MTLKVLDLTIYLSCWDQLLEHSEKNPNSLHVSSEDRNMCLYPQRDPQTNNWEVTENVCHIQNDLKIMQPKSCKTALDIQVRINGNFCLTLKFCSALYICFCVTLSCYGQQTSLADSYCLGVSYIQSFVFKVIRVKYLF